MYSIEVHRRVEQTISLFNFIGLWPGKIRSNFHQRCLKILNLILPICYMISVLPSSFSSDNMSEIVFISVIFIASLVQAVRWHYFVWKNEEIIKYIHSMGAHSIEDHQDFTRINKKINIFMKCATVYHFMIFWSLVVFNILTLPIISNTKRLPLNLYFPLNWKENEISYWIAFTFTGCEIMFISVYSISNTVIWYLMMCCGIKYELLGNEFKNLGKTILKTIVSVAEKQDTFFQELIALIKKHQRLQNTTNEFKKCFSNLFFIQIITSGLTICGPIYAIVFTTVENPFEYNIYMVCIVYLSLEIFMVTYFGNEIKFLSSRLLYCLFECDWVDQSKSCKKAINIFMEVLKRPQVLVIWIYPLDLQIFSKIVNLAYSMFNILKSL